MCKKMIVLTILLILLSGFYIENNVSNADEREHKVLIVYNQRFYFGYIQDMVTVVRELMGHFSDHVIEKNEKDYKKGQVEEYDFIFVVGLREKFTNEDFIKDVRETNKTICWMGDGVENFLKNNEKFHLNYEGNTFDTIKAYYDQGNIIDYNDMNGMKNFNIGGKRKFNVVTGDSDKIKIYAGLSDGERYYPYIVNENNFWYVSRVETEGVLFYVIADVLYEIFEKYSIEENKVYIRIEDVHPFRDTKKLRTIAEYLHNENIPFMIALIPAYRNPNSSYITVISEKPEFAETIRYMQRLGGSVILHGYTHEGFGGDLTGEGFEFWDGYNDRPPDVDMKTWVDEKIGKALKECKKNNIYPIGFEAPHYAMTQEWYSEIKKYFSTYVGHLQSTNKGFTTIIYPYNLYNTRLFNKLVPENLGYVDENDYLAVQNIMDHLDDVSVVRGFTAGLFFHPYIDIGYLKDIVEKLKVRNIKYYDLKSEYNWVKYKDISIISKNGKITTSFVKKEKEKEKNYFYRTTNVFGGLIIVCSIVFFVILIISKNKGNKKLFRRK